MAKKKMTLEEKLEEAIVKGTSYEVPRNWICTKLENIVEFERGITFAASEKKNEKGELDIACLRTANVQQRLEYDDLIYFDKKHMKSNNKKLVRDGDILMSTANSLELVGKCVLVPKLSEEMTFGGFVLNIRNRGLMNNKFIYYYLRSQFLLGNLQGIASQTTNIANINAKNLGNYVITIPPLKEQKRIVDRIESLFEKLDKAKELIEEAREDFESRKSVILEKAFRGELTKEWRKDNKVKYDFNDALLGDIIEEGPQNGLYKPQSAYGEGNMIVRIDNFYNGKINPWNTLKKLKLTVDDISKYSLENGDIIINRVNSIEYLGKSALVRELNETCVFESNIMRAKLNKNVNNEYVVYYLNSIRGLYELRKTAKHAVNQASINQQDVKRAIVPLPSIEEQNEIVKILDKLLEEESKIEELTVLEDQIELIKKSILAKAFRGELGTNCEDDESALELLKEILSKE